MFGLSSVDRCLSFLSLLLFSLCGFCSCLEEFESTEKKSSDRDIVEYLPNVSSLRVDEYKIVIEVELKERNSLLRINNGEPDIGGMVCSAFVDFGRGKLGYYVPFSTEDEKTEEILVEDDRIIPFEEGRKYIISSSKINGCAVKLSVTDETSNEVYEFAPQLKCYTSGITNAWGRNSYEVVGNIDVEDFTVYSTQGKHPKLLILGDSNADHGGLGSDKWRNYARQIKDSMRGDVFLVAQGGANTSHYLTWLNEYVFNVCQPQYCLITTYNETSYTRWHTNILQIIDRLEAHNIIPILATIHPGGGPTIDEQKARINEWIRKSGYFVFDIGKLVSLNNDGVTTDEDLLRPDLVHFNYISNNLLADSFMSEFPFLYREDSFIFDIASLIKKE